MLSASYFDPNDLGRALDLRNSFSLSSLSLTAPSWSLTITSIVSTRSSGAFWIQVPDRSARRVQQHVFPGRRYCPNPSHLHSVLSWNRASEKKQRTRDLRWWQQDVWSGTGRCLLLFQKGDQPVRKVRNVDTGALLGPQVSVLFHEAFHIGQEC